MQKIKKLRAVLGFSVSILAGVGLAGCPSDAEKLGVEFPLAVHRLGNGLKVVLVEDHTVPLINYQTWYRVGSVDERPGKTGLAHFFEHLMFKGTIRNGPKEFMRKLESKGAEVNAFTTRDYTVFHETFVPSLLSTVIDLESDRMANLVITEELLNTERMVVLEERKMRVDGAPDGRIQEELWKLAYQVHPYRNPVIGYPEDLQSMTVADLQSFFQAYYHPANATVLVVGDFQSGAVLKALEAAYGSIPSRSRPATVIAKEPEQLGERRLTIRDGVSSARLTHAYHISRAEDDDTYAIDVLSNILFEGRSSRAHRALVEESEAALGVSGASFTPKHPGVLMISGVLKKMLPADIPTAIRVYENSLSGVITRVQESGVSEVEVQRSVKQLTVQIIDSIRTGQGLAQLLGTVDATVGDPTRYARDLEKYLKVTPDDVKRVAQKYLTANNRTVIVLEPK